MASERQIAANRRNARKSTGPKSQAGRERSRMNALKHGLSRTRPAPEGPDPRVLPLARALAGDGVADPRVLALAEQVAVESLTLVAIRLMRGACAAGAEAEWADHARTDPQARAAAALARGDLLTNAASAWGDPSLFGAVEAGPGRADTTVATAGAPETPAFTPAPDPVRELRQLDRFERQALSRRSQALRRLDEALATLRGAHAAAADTAQRQNEPNSPLQSPILTGLPLCVLWAGDAEKSQAPSMPTQHRAAKKA